MDNSRHSREMRRLEFSQAGSKAAVKENIVDISDSNSEAEDEISQDNTRLSRETSRLEFSQAGHKAAVTENMVDSSDRNSEAGGEISKLQDEIGVFSLVGNNIISKRKAGEMLGLSYRNYQSFESRMHKFEKENEINPKKFKSTDDIDQMTGHMDVVLNKNSNKPLTDDEAAQLLCISLDNFMQQNIWENISKNDPATKELILCQIGEYKEVRNSGKPKDIKIWWSQPMVRKMLELYKRKIIRAEVAAVLLGVPITMFGLMDTVKEYDQNILSIERILSHKTLPNGSFTYMVLYKSFEENLSQKAVMVEEKDLIPINKGYIENYWKKKSKEQKDMDSLMIEKVINNSISSSLSSDAKKVLKVVTSENDQEINDKSPQSASKSKSANKRKCLEIDEDTDSSGDDDDNDNWGVDQILSHRKRKSRIEYLIAWEGYSVEEATWEPKENLVACLQMVNDYHIQLQSRQRNLTDVECGSLDIPNNTKRKEMETDNTKKKEMETDDTKRKEMETDNTKRKEMEKDNVNDNEKITKVLNERICDGVTQYLVQWQRSKRKFVASWETISSIPGFQDALNKYQHQKESQEIMDNKEKITKVLNERISDGVTKYLVQWQRSKRKFAPTWETISSIPGFQDALKEYQHQKESEEIMDNKEKITKVLNERISDGVTQYLVQWQRSKRKCVPSWETISSIPGFQDALKEYQHQKESEEIQKQIRKEMDYYSIKRLKAQTSAIDSFPTWLFKNNEGDYTCKYCSEDRYPLGQHFYSSYVSLRDKYQKNNAIFLLQYHAIDKKHVEHVKHGKGNSKQNPSEESVNLPEIKSTDEEKTRNEKIFSNSKLSSNLDNPHLNDQDTAEVLKDKYEEIRNENSEAKTQHKKSDKISGFMLWVAKFQEFLPKDSLTDLFQLKGTQLREWNKLHALKRKPFHDLAHDINITIQQLKEGEFQDNSLLTGYVLFSAEKRRELKLNNPKANDVQLSVFAFNSWKRLTKKKQDQYQERALTINVIKMVSILQAQGLLQEVNKKPLESTTFNQQDSQGFEAKPTQQAELEQTPKPKPTIDPNATKCFCGLSGNWYDRMLECQRCKRWFHEKCVGCLQYKLICGDRFYLYVCELCNSGSEFLHRLPINWENVVHLALWNLSFSKSKSYSGENGKYFEYEEQITTWVNIYWDLLQCPPDLQIIPIMDRTQKILEALKGNPIKFKCGKKGKKNSIWGLTVADPPTTLEMILPPESPITLALMDRISYCDRTKELTPIPKTFKVDAVDPIMQIDVKPQVGTSDVVDQDNEDDNESDESDAEVESLLNHREVDGEREYLVKWLGYDESESTWEPQENLDQCPDIVNEYFKKNTVGKNADATEEPTDGDPNMTSQMVEENKNKAVDSPKNTPNLASVNLSNNTSKDTHSSRISNISNISSSSSSSPAIKAISKDRLKVERILGHEGGSDNPESYLVGFCQIGNTQKHRWIKAANMLSNTHYSDLVIKYWAELKTKQKLGNTNDLETDGKPIATSQISDGNRNEEGHHAGSNNRRRDFDGPVTTKYTTGYSTSSYTVDPRKSTPSNDSSGISSNNSRHSIGSSTGNSSNISSSINMSSSSSSSNDLNSASPDSKTISKGRLKIETIMAHEGGSETPKSYLVRFCRVGMSNEVKFGWIKAEKMTADQHNRDLLIKYWDNKKANKASETISSSSDKMKKSQLKIKWVKSRK